MSCDCHTLYVTNNWDETPNCVFKSGVKVCGADGHHPKGSELFVR